MIDSAVDIFDNGQKTRKQTEAKVGDLYRQIGQLNYVDPMEIQIDTVSKSEGMETVHAARGIKVNSVSINMERNPIK